MFKAKRGSLGLLGIRRTRWEDTSVSAFEESAAGSTLAYKFISVAIQGKGRREQKHKIANGLSIAEIILKK